MTGSLGMQRGAKLEATPPHGVPTLTASDLFRLVASPCYVLVGARASAMLHPQHSWLHPAGAGTG